MGRKKTVFRNFFYFRIGYAYYLVMVIGIVNILTTTYFLAAQQISVIVDIFPTFEIYVSVVIFVGSPIVILVGWIHFKRIGTFSAEAAIMAQAHPFNYKLFPGYHKEVYGPAYLEILQLNIKRLNGEKLTLEEISYIKHLEDQLQKLIDGDYVGKPPKGVL